MMSDRKALVRILNLPQPPPLADFGQYLLDVLHAHVGLEQFLFQLVEKLLVDLPSGQEESADIGIENLRGFPQRAFELVEGFGEESHGADDKVTR